MFVYTIQPVVKPVVQPAVSCKRGLTEVAVDAGCVQEFKDLGYEVLRRSRKQQALGLESRLPKQHAVFYVGLSITVLSPSQTCECDWSILHHVTLVLS